MEWRDSFLALQMIYEEMCLQSRSVEYVEWKVFIEYCKRWSSTFTMHMSVKADDVQNILHMVQFAREQMVVCNIDCICSENEKHVNLAKRFGGLNSEFVSTALRSLDQIHRKTIQNRNTPIVQIESKRDPTTTQTSSSSSQRPVEQSNNPSTSGGSSTSAAFQQFIDEYKQIACVFKKEDIQNISLYYAGMTTRLVDVVTSLTEYLVHPLIYTGNESNTGQPYSVLFVGPPGTGKSRLAEYISHMAATRCGQVTFLSVSARDIMRHLVGQTEQRVSALFEFCRQNLPCILFIDEIDALTSSRDSQHRTPTNVLTELMVELSGIGSSRNTGILFIGCTNHADPKSMDSAMINRMRKIEIPLPNESARCDFFKFRLQMNKHVEDKISIKKEQQKCTSTVTKDARSFDISELDLYDSCHNVSIAEDGDADSEYDSCEEDVEIDEDLQKLIQLTEGYDFRTLDMAIVACKEKMTRNAQEQNAWCKKHENGNFYVLTEFINEEDFDFDPETCVRYNNVPPLKCICDFKPTVSMLIEYLNDQL